MLCDGELLAAATCCQQGSLQDAASFQVPGLPEDGRAQPAPASLGPSCTCTGTPSPPQKPHRSIALEFVFPNVAIWLLLLC